MYSFYNPTQFPELLHQMPINEETLSLLNCFVASDIRLQSYLVDMRWDLLKNSLAQMQFEDALLLKMIVINFRLVSDMFDVDQFEEIFDVLNEIEVARQQNAIKSGSIKQWANVLGIFLRNLASHLTGQMIESIAGPLKAYIESIKKETYNETLKANLQFILSLTKNENFMHWAKLEMIDLFNLMERNIEKTFVTLDTVDVAVQIHNNLLLNVDYAKAFIENSQR